MLYACAVMASDQLRLTQAERMGACLDEGTVAAVIEGARAAGERNDDLVRTQLTVLRSQGTLACASGCSWCCTLGVSVRFAEVARLADFINRTFTADERAALTSRLVAHCEANALLTAEALAVVRRPCPLLVDARCSAYEARPLACRGWNSAKVDPCRDDAERQDPESRVPVHTAVRRTALEIAGGLRDAARAHGLDDSELDMPEALLEALPDLVLTTQRWLAGSMPAERQRIKRRGSVGGPGLERGNRTT